MQIHSWMVCHRPQSQAVSQSQPQKKSTRYGDRTSGSQRPTPVKNAA